MDADVLTTRVADGIAVITLGTARRIYIDQETSDALYEVLNKCAGDADIRVVIVTGAAPGSFVRHYSIPELIRFAESVRATGREWPEARFIDGPISVCESMPKPVIAAISGTCLAGAFELTLSCDLRIAEDGDYQIGFPEPNFGLCPGAGGTQRLARTIGTSAALMHILMGVPVSPREAERRGLVHETVSGHASRSRDGDCPAPVVIHAGVARLHQASGPQRHRDAARPGTVTRAQAVYEIVPGRRRALSHADL